MEDSGLSGPGVGLWSYNTSKSAANALTQQLAVTLGKRKITVNGILPGVYPSKMTAFGLKNDTEGNLAKSRKLLLSSASIYRAELNSSCFRRPYGPCRRPRGRE